MKTCSKCTLELPDNAFTVKYKVTGGLNSICKVCICKINKEYNNKNKEKLSTKRHEYYKNNIVKILTNKKIYQTLNAKEIYQKQKIYNNKNREKLTKYRLNYYRNKRKSDPYFLLESTIRTRFKQAMKLMSKNGKTKSCSEYGIDFKAIYDKVGPKPNKDYHLDHIIPLAKFDLDNVEHIKLAHLPCNLQWIASKDNLLKRDNIPDIAYHDPDLKNILITIGII